MNRRRLLASLLVAGAVAWGMALAPLQMPRATLPAPPYATGSPTFFFAPDAKHLVVVHFQEPREAGAPAGNLGCMRLWDMARGNWVGVLTHQKCLINSVTFSPDGTTIAGRQEDGRILLWNRSTGRRRDELWPEHLKEAHLNAQIVYTPEGRLLYQDAQNWTIMRHVDDGRVAFDFRHEVRECNSGTVHHQGYYLAAGKGLVVVVRIDTGAGIARFQGEGESDTNGALAPDGRSYASTPLHDPSRIFVWMPEKQNALPPFAWFAPTWNVQQRMSLSNDGITIAVNTTYRTRRWIFFGAESKEPKHRVQLIDVQTATDTGRIDGGVSSMFAPDNRTLAVCLANGDVQLWDLPLRRPWTWIALASVAIAALTYGLLAWRAHRQSCRQSTAVKLPA